MDPWKKYITYDLRDGEIRYEERAPHENGTPAWLYNGLGEQFRLPDCRDYDETSLIASFRCAFGGKLEELREGFEAYHNGDWRGRWNDDDDGEHHAYEMMALEERVKDWAEHQGVEVWDASDWFLGGMSDSQVADELGLTAATTDDDLDAIAERADAAVDVRLVGTRAFVEYVRDRLADYNAD